MSNKKDVGKKDGGTIDISKMTKEQLEVYTAKITEEIEREREERNYFQIERDNIQTFWDISRQQLRESRTLNRVLQKEAQDFSKKFDQDSLAARKKLTHLIHTYQTEAANTNIEHIVALKKYQNQFAEKKVDLIANYTKNIKVENDANLACLNQNHALKLEHRQILEKMKEEFDKDLMYIQNQYDEKLIAYRKNFSLKHNMELMEVEERKNEHTNALLKEHETSFQELKSFYNNILLNNLAVIDNLKKKFNALKKNEIKMMGQIKNKNN